jgi:ABC-type Mn2+/Zn2+ transport system permease subunit
VLEAFDAPYMQRALLLGLLLAPPLGLLGTWVVLRALAFFAHAVGVATFPGAAVGLAVPAVGPVAGALVAALAFAGAVSTVERDHRLRGGAVTGLALAASLAVGTVLLTSALETTVAVESVLFGSLLAVSDADVARAGVAGLLGTGGMVVVVRRVAAATFDREWAGAAGGRPVVGDAVILVLVAFTVVAALPAAGSLLVSGLLVVPAATARLVCERLGPMLACAVALCAVETAAGLALARALDASPGAAIATLAGAGFAAAAGARGLARALRRGRAATGAAA